MIGRIEAAQEQLERAAYEWQKARKDLIDVNRYDAACEALDESVTNLHIETMNYLKGKGSIQR